MTYQETLDYLYQQLPMFQRVGPMAFKKDLTNIRILCAALGHPQERLRCVHIAGTNGKGSTAHMMAAVLQAAGYRTGLYTSPHYRDYRERIKIDGELVTEAYVIDFVAQHKELMEEVKPSFFEISVAMAFDYFAKQKVDWAVIEVGMGGRLDSTNILLPELCLITNISFDHQQYLGSTLTAIAGEKAGIIKPGVPVVISETQEETAPVFKAKAKKEFASIVFADQHFKAVEKARNLEHTTYDVEKDGELLYEGLKVNVHGNYQCMNVQAVLQAVELLPDDIKIEEAALRSGLAELRSKTRFIGRWQLISRQPMVICDSAHNEAGLEAVAKELDTLFYEQLHIVMGMVNDKPPHKLLPYLPEKAHYYFARPDIPRGLDAKKLAKEAAKLGRKGEVYESVPKALEAAKANAGDKDVVFVGGSIFVVAEII
jgi:dihydrofolate synthase/folylpolyglutamate synthase